MKRFLNTLLVAFALASTAFAQSGTQNPQAPNTKFKGTNNEIPSGVKLWLNGTLTPAATASMPTVLRAVSLGAPIVATTNRIVTSTNMKVGSYTIAAQPDVPRNITVTATTVATGADTPGTIVVTGTDNLDAVITETIVPSQGSTVAGTKAFKTVTSVVGAGWVIAGGNDTIVVGVGNLIGLPVTLTPATGYAITSLSGTLAHSATTGGATRALSTVDASGGTYNGTKVLTVYLAY